MEHTKYECGNLRIVIEEPVKAALGEKGFIVSEVHRLIESFGNKLLMTRSAGEIDFTNKTTGTSLKLDMQWEDDDSAVVYVKGMCIKELPQAAA